MAIKIICGMPGDGKSLKALIEIVAVLTDTNQHVMTNLPILRDKFAEWLHLNRPKDQIFLLERLTILTDAQTARFWDMRKDRSQHPEGVAFFIDEAHEFFSAREWQAFGKDAMSYLSQHRHFGDAVFPITQAPGNLDKQFRSLTAHYIRCRNYRLRKYWIFKGADYFKWEAFYNDPTGASSKVQPFAWGKFNLDAGKGGLANCYDTSAGANLVGGGKADKGSRAKGLHIYWVFPMMMGLAALAGIIPWLLGKGAQRVLVGSAVQKMRSSNSPAVLSALAGQNPSPSLQSPALQPATGQGHLLKQVYYTGVVRIGSKIRVFLSDGTSASNDDVRFIYDDHVVLNDGRTLWADPTVKPPSTVAKAPYTGSVAQLDFPKTNNASIVSDSQGTGQSPPAPPSNRASAFGPPVQTASIGVGRGPSKNNPVNP